MVEYVNDLQRFVVGCLAERISSNNVDQINGQDITVGEFVLVGKYTGFEESGELFVSRVCSVGGRGSPELGLDDRIREALTGLNSDHGFHVEEHRLPNGIVIYYVKPEKTFEKIKVVSQAY